IVRTWRTSSSLSSSTDMAGPSSAERQLALEQLLQAVETAFQLFTAGCERQPHVAFGAECPTLDPVDVSLFPGHPAEACRVGHLAAGQHATEMLRHVEECIKRAVGRQHPDSGHRLQPLAY